MSLSRLAMRIAAARAVRGATLAEDRVFDSAIDPIDLAIAGNRQPILVVMTDEHEAIPVGRDLFHADISCDLVIDAAIAARVEIGGEVSITIPHTDEGMELVLDMMEHQVIAALTRECSGWSRVWMKLVPRVKRRLSRRGASAEGGVRFAARQIVLTCDLIEAPAGGAAIVAGSAWADVLTVMEEDAALKPIADLLRLTIEGAGVAEWKRAANMLGIHKATAKAIGLGPVLDEGADPASVAAVTVTGGMSASLDEAAAAEQGFPHGGP
ncbi:MAG: hypothetical protein ACKOED_04885 [Aestuariivirga sp.]|uniref:hypothetical protein n=1 Tax=Aestuariivirga sp. TaxID=2650926 RepID=UPI0038CF6A76